MYEEGGVRTRPTKPQPSSTTPSLFGLPPLPTTAPPADGRRKVKVNAQPPPRSVGRSWALFHLRCIKVRRRTALLPPHLTTSIWLG